MIEYVQLLKQLNDAPIVKDTKELLGIKFKVDRNLIEFKHGRNYEQVLHYLKAELAWYLSGSSSIKDISKYSQVWKSIANKGKVNSNYGRIVFHEIHDINFDFKDNELKLKIPTTMFDYAFDALCKDVDTRKSIILYNNPKYFNLENKDFICTQTQQFFIRNGILHSIVNIRSSDAIYGLTYDIPWYSLVQQAMVHEYNENTNNPVVLCGDLTIMIGSSHIYQRHFEHVKSMILSDFKMHNVRIKNFGLFKEVINKKMSFDSIMSEIENIFWFE